MSPSELERQLATTWIQCTGPSIFGPQSGGAVEILANGTWRQLARTPGGWQPLEGPDDAGTWQLLQAPAPVGAVALVRFVAAVSDADVAPQEWTAGVTLTTTQPERAQFVEGTVVANYLRLAPSATGGSAPGT